MTTLSDYNNNPGNLRPPKGVTYEGQIGVDDKGFAVFQNRDFGHQALVNDINHKIDRGINTPEDFVNVFTPAGPENSEDARDNYKIHLANSLGLTSTKDPFPDNSSDRLAHAVSAFEGGTWASQPKDAIQKPVSQATSTEEEPQYRGKKVDEKSDADVIKEDDTKRRELAAISGVVGTGAGGLWEVKSPLIRVMGKIGLLPGGKTISPQDAAAMVEKTMTANAPEPTAQTPETSGDKWSRKVVGSMGPGGESVTEASRNYRMQQGLTPEEAAHYKASRTGLILPNAYIPETQTTEVTPLPTQKPSGALSRALGYTLGSSPVRGGLAGYSLGSNLQEAFQRQKEKDYIGAATAGAGAVGDVMSLAPATGKILSKVGPLGAAISGGANVYRNIREQNIPGAVASAASAAAPYVAPFLLGPEVGIPVGIATALGIPIGVDILSRQEK